MVDKKIKLSVALATLNEEANLDACLSSVASVVSEIVVVDGGSTDKTIEVASKYGARVIKTTNPAIFHINKQKALDACTSEWILQLDADEVVPVALLREIETTIDKNPVENGYYIPRKNYFWGRFMKKGGQYPDHVIRLVRKNKAKFPSLSVHEQIAIEGKVGYLKEPMLHYSYRTFDDYWRKARSYTALTAREFARDPSSGSILFLVRSCIYKPLETFFNLYLRHKGFMDGWQGLFFAGFSAAHHPIAYLKFKKVI